MVQRISFFLIVLFLFGENLSASPVPIVDSRGILLGANNVNVEGDLYDVRFVDGRCVAVFNGCDEVTDFLFTSILPATAASQALIDQVIIGTFRTRTDLIAGCGPDTGDILVCEIITPWGLANIAPPDERPTIAFQYESAYFPAIGESFISQDDRPRYFDTSCCDNVTFAVWSPSPIPEPSTFWTLGVGLFAFAKLWGRKI